MNSLQAESPPVLPEGYRLGRVLGKGATSIVYEARDHSGRRLAIKVLNRRCSEDQKLVAAFERGAKAAMKIHHNHVIAVHEVDVSGPDPYLVMDYGGRSLAEIALLTDLYLESPSLVADLARQAALGLSEIHGVYSDKLVHRDLKLSNILIDEEGRVRITDLDLTLHVSSQDELTSSELFDGTIPYMSPEQIQGRDIDCRSDLFSLGVVLYTLVVGERPYGPRKGERKLFPTMMRIANEPPLDPRRLNRRVSRDLEAIILHLLEKKAESRYSSAGMLIYDLERFLAWHPTSAWRLLAWPSGLVFDLTRKWNNWRDPLCIARPRSVLNTFCRGFRVRLLTAHTWITWALLLGLHFPRKHRTCGNWARHRERRFFGADR